MDGLVSDPCQPVPQFMMTPLGPAEPDHRGGRCVEGRPSGGDRRHQADALSRRAGRGIQLPAWVQSAPKAVDITTHQFDVALSFPGEVRGLVEEVAHNLEALIGPNAYFYDNNYVAQLARPALDMLLQDIYRNRSKLIVLFVGADYERKDWCGIEFRAIRDIIATREHNRIMFVRTDDGAVEGVFATDGYVDARHFAPEVLAGFIQERVGLL
jgi:hypothetical protein